MPHITNVFVLMLENHSFDNIFAMSGIAGIAAATAGNTNAYNGQTYPVQGGAPVTMPTDPGHEFLDVFEQLAGAGAVFNPNEQYAPAIVNSGFASNYATTTSEGSPPQPGDIGKIMACFTTPTQLPVIYQLATEFAICDRWFSSLPGPTWPNRYFVHGASSAGLDHSPTDTEMAEWDTIDGFQYPHGSIYDALGKNGLKWRLYNDKKDSNSDDPQSMLGGFAQVASLQGVHLTDVNPLSQFAADLQGNYPYHYTFIEPNYGDIVNNTYRGGSSQHPMDDVFGGESLIKTVYEAIRNSPVWNSSLLIVTYDEHGGFYDSVAPDPAAAPDDGASVRFNKYGFNFRQLGVRVPAVVVSPLIPRGTVDHIVHDHSSIPATLEAQFGFGALTGRDQNANHVLHLLTLTAPRTDCPAALADPAPPAARPAAAAAPTAADAERLPSYGNLRGALAIAAKTDFELSSGSDADKAAIVQKHHKIHTRGEAREYLNSVLQKVQARGK